MSVNTSNELLLSIINSRLKELTDKDKIKVYYDDIDLVRLIKGIEENNDNMKYLTDSPLLFTSSSLVIFSFCD